MTTPTARPEGPATTDAVVAWLPGAAPTGELLDQLAQVVAGVNAVVRRWCSPAAVAEDGTETWAPDHQAGAVMLVGRMWHRRATPGGVEAFGADGVAYVARTDPDVSLLLELGAYARPRVG